MVFKESEILELKQSTSELKEAVVSIAAILNKHHHGILYFGIKNNGEVVGQNITEKTLREISQTIANNIEPKIYPEIKSIVIKDKPCVEIQFSGGSAPYFAYGRAYIRVGDENRQLSAREIESLFLKKNADRHRWESEISDYSFSQINNNTLKEYISKSNTAGRINFKFESAKTILKKLGLFKNNKMLKAAEILFCDNNKLEVQAAVFAGTDKVTFIDIKQFKGNLFYLLEKSEEYIKEHINWRVEIKKIERDEIPEIPIKAIREALVNSLCHCDYYAPESNKIAIFKNRVEIYNPGAFPEGLSPQDFIRGEEQSVLRNPLIADILYKSKEIEKWGSGLKRIYEECKDSKTKVLFKKLKTGFIVSFERNPDFEPKINGEIPTPKLTPKLTPKSIETLPPKLPPKTSEKIIDLIKQNPKITKEQISKELKISRAAIKYHIIKLTRQNYLRWEGPSKNGEWKFLKDDQEK